MTTLAVHPRPDQARAGIGTQLYTAVMLAALVAGAWWAFQFRVEALLSGLNPNCPVTGCYADFGPTWAPIAALAALAAGVWLAARVLRTGAVRPMTWLLALVAVQWAAVLMVVFASLVD